MTKLNFILLTLFAYLIFSTSATSWQETFGINPLKLQGNLTQQCRNDTTVFLNALGAVGKVAEECLLLKKCTAEDMKILKENEFAIQQIDAFAKLPVPGLLELTITYDGSYQECKRISGVKYETNYCYLILKPGKNASCVPGDPNDMTSLLSLKSAVCMPYSCDSDDLSTIFNQVDILPFTVCGAYCAHHEVEKDSAFWGFTIFMIVMIIIAFLATLFDYIREIVYEAPSTKEKNLFLKMFLAFSFWTNAGLLLSVKEQKPGFIKSLDCIRFFSMMWVVTGHGFLNVLFGDDLMPIVQFPKNIWNHLIMNAFVSVDTFFCLSGIVVAYLFFKERPKERMIKNPITWVLFYVHRYLRLTPPMMLFIGFFTVYAAYIQGPYSASAMNSLIPQAEMCKTGWWENLLYINNFADSQNGCYAITWYLAVDTQLYLIAPILLIGLYYSFAAGALLIVVGCVGSFIAVYVMTSVDNLPADLFGNGDQTNFFTSFYEKPWIRCPPYLVGILTGYIIATYGKRQIRLNWVLSVVGWIFAFGIGAACLFSTNDYDKGTHWGAFSRGTFYNFSRFGWAVALSWVIIANHMGWGGPINNFMSHPIWQPFGRLSYCAYIVHWMTLFFYVNLGDRPIHYYSAWQFVLYYTVPVTILSFIFAFFWSCLFEVPTLKLEKMLIEGIIGSTAKPSNKVDHELGKNGTNGVVVESKAIWGEEPLSKSENMRL